MRHLGRNLTLVCFLAAALAACSPANAAPRAHRRHLYGVRRREDPLSRSRTGHARRAHPRLHGHSPGQLVQQRRGRSAGQEASRRGNRLPRSRQERQAARPEEVRPADGQGRARADGPLEDRQGPRARLFDGRLSRHAVAGDGAQRFITASYGGSGVPEVEEAYKREVPKDEPGPDPQEAEASAKLRTNPDRDNEALLAVRSIPGRRASGA